MDTTPDIERIGGQYLSFSLGHENYAVDILKVQEIRSYEKPTRMASSSVDFLGVVNMRGVIVPIHDLRVRLNCASAELTSSTVVIVFDLGSRIVGALVDAVCDVVQLTPGSVKPAPPLGEAQDEGYFLGLAQAGERMLVLLDVVALLSPAVRDLKLEEACAA
jgi:purine-binding chemotaxis protein CheW